MILTDDPRQRDLAELAENKFDAQIVPFPHSVLPDPNGLARRLADRPLRPSKPQAPCDHGLFSDEAAQLDLAEVSLWR